MTATYRDPPGWITRLRKIEQRRGSRCRVCGSRKVIATHSGPHCRPHAALLPPPIIRHRTPESDQ